MSRLLLTSGRVLACYPLRMDCSRTSIRWKINLSVDPTELRTKKLPRIELEPGERLPLENKGNQRLRVYKTLVVNTDGSSYYADSPMPYEITFLPLDFSNISEAELQSRRIAHLPDKQLDEKLDEGFSSEEMVVADDYKHLI